VIVLTPRAAHFTLCVVKQQNYRQLTDDLSVFQ